MKAPEKIYLDPHPYEECYEDEWYKSPVSEASVEYTRTDAFIEKAVEWIRYNNENGGCQFDNWEESFRKYMKE